MYDYQYARMREIFTQHPLTSIFVAAIFIRVLHIASVKAGNGTFFAEDDFYIQMAFEWAQQLGLIDGLPQNEGFRERMPLYPLLIAILSLSNIDSPLSIIFVNIVIDSGTCVIIAMLGCRLDRRVGVLAGTLGAIWPNLVIHSALVLNDTLFVFLFTSMLFWSLEYLKKPRIHAALFGGILLGLAILTRPIGLILAPSMLIACFVIAIYQKMSVRRSLVLAFAFILPTVIFVGPLILYNKVTFGNVTLTAQTGTHLANWIIPAVRKAENGTPLRITRNEMREKYLSKLDHLGIKDPDMFEESQILTSLAFKELSESSSVAIAKAWLKGMAINLLAPAILIDTRVRAMSTQSFYNLDAPNFISKVISYVAGNNFLYLLLFILGIVGSVTTFGVSLYGLLLLWVRFPWAATFSFLAVMYFLFVNGPVASPKYRLPVEPIILVMVSLGILGFWDKFHTSKR